MKNAANPLLIAGAAMILMVGISQAATTVDLGCKSRGTPYEPYMGSVKEVLRTLDRQSEPEYKQVCNLLRTARNFRYRFATAYVPNSPDTTESRRSGDCKDKSLWLVDRMGAGEVRFVIGRMRATSTVKHAWLYWEHEGKWYILDPTHRSTPLPVSSVNPGNYVPYYSYAPDGAAYRHGSTASMFASAERAGGPQEAVASAGENEKAGRRSGSKLIGKRGTGSDRVTQVSRDSSKTRDKVAGKNVTGKTEASSLLSRLERADSSNSI